MIVKREIGTPFDRSVFWPNNVRIPRISTEFLEKSENDALRNCLLIRELALSKTNCDVRERGFE
jgi:hypothetical protein